MHNRDETLNTNIRKYPHTQATISAYNERKQTLTYRK